MLHTDIIVAKALFYVPFGSVIPNPPTYPLRAGFYNFVFSFYFTMLIIFRPNFGETYNTACIVLRFNLFSISFLVHRQLILSQKLICYAF